ncbi:MAG: hypothetical protein JW781_03375 [Deltaproteobacteria bacterium]|nr:hypothetical protein [Candidatus Anaeroferrophillacea bacterium]
MNPIYHSTEVLAKTYSKILIIAEKQGTLPVTSWYYLLAYQRQQIYQEITNEAQAENIMADGLYPKVSSAPS